MSGTQSNRFENIVSRLLSLKTPSKPPEKRSVTFTDLRSQPVDGHSSKKTLLRYRSRAIRHPDAIVHLEYPPDSPPERPPVVEGEQWTRFVCISDTHTRQIDVPDGDVLLHSGDLTNIGTVKDFETTIGWLCSLPHKLKIIIAGNHDLTLHKEWYEVYGIEGFHSRIGKQDIGTILKLLKGKSAKAANLVYLQDEEYRFKVRDGGKEWSVYGSPWSPEFCNWAFGYEPEDAPELISKFPKTDILLTHGPPYALLDRTRAGDYAGCKALRQRLPQLKPRLHVFGHIHEAHGAYVHDWSVDKMFPKVQNDEDRGVEDSTSPEEVLEGLDPLTGIGEEIRDQPPSDDDDDDDDDSYEADEPADDLSPDAMDVTDDEVNDSDRPSVFVNAAAWPMGKLSMRDGARSRMSTFGGPGFQAVIVDLKE